MSSTMHQAIEDYRRGGFKRFRLYLADDDGFGHTELVGGYDSRDEAIDTARAIEEHADKLIRDGFALPTDERVRVYFWIYDREAECFAGRGYMLPPA